MATWEGAADQDRRAGRQDPAQLGGTGAKVGNVVDDGGQPCCSTGRISQGNGLAVASDDRHLRREPLALRLSSHAGSGLQGQDRETEPVDEGLRPDPGTRAHIKHRAPRSGGQVFGQPLAPLVEHAKRMCPTLVVGSGRPVVVDPGH